MKNKDINYPKEFYSIYREIKENKYRDTVVVCEDIFIPMQKNIDKKRFMEFLLEQRETITEYTKSGFYCNNKLIVFINKASLFMI